MSIAITRVGPFPPRMSNVGVVIDLAVHDIDLIRWFTDSDIVEVQPQLSNAVAEREDIALLQFRTASGVLAHINTNWLTPFKARNVTIATRDKYVMGDLLTRQVTECFGFQRDGTYSMRHLSVGHDEPLRAELIAFIDAVRDRNEPAVTGEQAWRASKSRISLPHSQRRPGNKAASAAAARPADLRDLSIHMTLDEPMRSIARADPIHRRRGPAPSAWASDRRGDRSRHRALPVSSRSRGRTFEGRSRGILRRAHAVSLRERHRCADAGADGEGIGPGDAVLCPPSPSARPPRSVALLGATPVFADVDEATFNIDPRR